MPAIASDNVISTTLKHDSKVTSYKLALLRAINDVVLTYPELRTHQSDMAVPLKLLAGEYSPTNPCCWLQVAQTSAGPGASHLVNSPSCIYQNTLPEADRTDFPGARRRLRQSQVSTGAGIAFSIHLSQHRHRGLETLLPSSGLTPARYTAQTPDLNECE